MKDRQLLRRWSTFGSIFLANMLPEFLWSNFPPIITLIEKKYAITESVASLPIIVFSAGTVISAGFAGRMIDRRGYRVATLVGLALAAVCAVLRTIEGPFWVLVMAQGGIGAAFSFIAGASSSYVADWFDRKRAALMSGVCVVALYLGLGSSMVITPVLVSRLGFSGTMRATAAASVVVLLLGFALLRPRSQLPLPLVASRGRPSFYAELLRNRSVMLLLVISFLTGGLFSAVATALEPIWAQRGFTPEQAGVADGLFILGGVVGSLGMPLLQSWTGSARTVLILCSIAIVLLTFPLLATSNLLIGYLIAVAIGVFWMGNIPICYTLLERAAGAERSGVALSAFWAINSAGSVLLVWMFTAVMEHTCWQLATWVTLALLALNLGAAFALPTLGRYSEARAARGPESI
jgi:predicted MFS family arabinose efflux permease